MHRRRPVLLLEVVIAAFLLALVAVPLMRPSVGMLIREKRAIRALEVEERYSQMHSELIVALYRQEIPWEQITDGNWHRWNGVWFSFRDAGHKPKGEGMEPQFFKFWISLAFKEQEKERVHRSYPLLLERKIEEVVGEKE